MNQSSLPPDDGAPLKAETLRELLEAVGEDAFAQIRAEFLSSTELGLAEMLRAAQGGDGEALRRGAHRLKGSSGSIGAARLERMCVELASTPGGGDVIAAVALMSAEFAAVRRALEERR